MATVTLKGNPFETLASLPATGASAPDFNLVGADLGEIKLSDFSGKRLILNIFPSIDTATCAMSVRKFNQSASELDNTVVLCISADLPFAQSRFCGAEGLSNVKTASTFRSSFGADYGVQFSTGPLRGLLSRSIVVVGADGKVIHTEQVQETVNEPDYEAAIAALS
jgi:thiol peroxidase